MSSKADRFLRDSRFKSLSHTYALAQSHVTEITQAGSSTRRRPNPATSRPLLTWSASASLARGVRLQVANQVVAYRSVKIGSLRGFGVVPSNTKFCCERKHG